MPRCPWAVPGRHACALTSVLGFGCGLMSNPGAPPTEGPWGWTEQSVRDQGGRGVAWGKFLWRRTRRAMLDDSWLW